MCTIAVSHRVHPRYPLIVAANRDEFYERPSAAAAFWENDDDILAGRDLRGGGTWMGITRRGRFAALTNLRNGPGERAGAPSRGEIVVDFLRSNERPQSFLDALSSVSDRYNGFNLLVSDRAALGYYSNRGRGPEMLEPGVYALSNALLGTDWPKIRRMREALETLTTTPRVRGEDLLEVLNDSEIAPDDALPGLGGEPEWERALSAIFISTPEYGTCSSTAIVTDAEGRVEFVERRAPAHTGGEATVRRFEFDVIE